MSYCILITCQAIFLELSLNVISNEQNLLQSKFINSMILDFLMLSRIELKTFCVLGRRGNRYSTAPELS